jgi:hypothetical protein
MKSELMIQIENSFTYHAPKAGQPELYKELRDKAKELALFIATSTPDSREQLIAIEKIEEAIMWANKGIALHGR